MALGFELTRDVASFCQSVCSARTEWCSGARERSLPCQWCESTDCQWRKTETLPLRQLRAIHCPLTAGVLAVLAVNTRACTAVATDAPSVADRAMRPKPLRQRFLRTETDCRTVCSSSVTAPHYSSTVLVALPWQWQSFLGAAQAPARPAGCETICGPGLWREDSDFPVLKVVRSDGSGKNYWLRIRSSLNSSSRPGSHCRSTGTGGRRHAAAESQTEFRSFQTGQLTSTVVCSALYRLRTNHHR